MSAFSTPRRLQVLKKIPVGKIPWGVAITPGRPQPIEDAVGRLIPSPGLGSYGSACGRGHRWIPTLRFEGGAQSEFHSAVGGQRDRKAERVACLAALTTATLSGSRMCSPGGRKGRFPRRVGRDFAGDLWSPGVERHCSYACSACAMDGTRTPRSPELTAASCCCGGNAGARTASSVCSIPARRSSARSKALREQCFFPAPATEQELRSRGRAVLLCVMLPGTGLAAQEQPTSAAFRFSLEAGKALGALWASQHRGSRREGRLPGKLDSK